MKRFVTGLMFACLTLGIAYAQEEEEMDIQEAVPDLGWVNGPADVNIAGIATVGLPEEFTYLDSDDTAALMELFQNPQSEDEYFVGPSDLRWWAVFSFEDSGYIEDDEDIDPDDLLASLREGNEYSNRERRDRGWPELHITGWQYAPFYEEDSNRLAWAIRAESEGQEIVNYNTRVLGRSGVMSAILVASPEVLDDSVAEFKRLLTGFSYDSGQRYADWVPGDKVATYGLAALITGGAAAAVAKSGAAKGLFKAIGIGMLAFFAGISGWVKKKFKGKNA